MYWTAYVTEQTLFVVGVGRGAGLARVIGVQTRRGAGLWEKRNLGQFHWVNPYKKCKIAK